MARRFTTILAIGQDLFSIDAYVKSQYNYSLHRYLQLVDDDRNRLDGGNSTADSRRSERRQMPAPSLQDSTPPVFMAYTDIQTLRGLDRPTDYGSGVEYADGILQLVRFRDEQHASGAKVGLQLGLWLNGTEGCRDIVHRRLDSQIQRLVNYLSTSTTPTSDRVWLRIGYEFDNPSFGYLEDPELYRQAFRTIVAACRSSSQCRERTRFVWHSWAASVESADELHRYYPGDDVVDWVGISIFSQLYPAANDGGVARLGNGDTVRAVLVFAKGRGKPTMIAESTPFGGIPTRVDPWEAWFQPVLNLIHEHGIGMWSYINCDWEVRSPRCQRLKLQGQQSAERGVHAHCFVFS
jgi:Glycosyl hydrolase family 26